MRFFFQAEDGIRAGHVTGVQTCALPILAKELHDRVLYADADMNKADWMTAVGGIVGILGIGLGLWWADSVAALFISGSILYDGLRNMRSAVRALIDRKSTRLNSSHVAISYAVFCLKKKNKTKDTR